ncbi:cubilin-like [Daktulosphaira vitifoliae]|uniref:cubilin-like n=1 Tax=Daktulosphaira vitifoliae TaxID=58002 RepID=UPI0021A9B90D|nr:cubilin-like [Daktulosphaira vitifoliae]XP_050533067.1 cubilin-like [Daktulosphaira vitifoliae]XP_050533068.1 cubilin-like [Daktulosphaira vitifoliae]XP_050533069.1 cubilin-like [Daktulosphaira vitifoliae]
MAQDYWHARRRLLVSLLLLSSIRTSYQKALSGCDLTFVSHSSPQNGTFRAPEIINSEGESKVCVYTFVAASHQKAYVSFTSFQLRSTPPECMHEYVDVYSELQQVDTEDLINSPFGGRYCGLIPPRDRISLYRTVAISFYTDKNSTTPTLFEGQYSFQNDSSFQLGTPSPISPCSFVVHSKIKKQGSVLTPTYPGIYPKGMKCTYLFLGQPSQRVRLEFRDFDLFYGGPHCPFDIVSIYDGSNSSSPLIGQYCGQQRNLVIYSTYKDLYVTFDTLQRATNTQNRGFKGMFEFSESFVKLDFIGKNDGEHVRGTECDQKVLSKKTSSGFIYSPNFPFPYIPKIVCRYFIYGFEGAQNLERVRLEFFIFDIPKPRRSEQDCTDGYLKVYLKGQEAMDLYDKFDYEMCGEESDEKVLMSEGARLAMVFSSGEQQGRGFKAKYTFETEYLVPGTAAPNGTCHFSYRSASKKRGDFNSPRHPANYPNGLNCTFLFLPTPNEQVTLIFDQFSIRADKTNVSFVPFGVSVCTDDWLEIYNIYNDNTEKLIGRYCGKIAPGPLESNRGALGLKVVLHTNSEGVSSGFKARYFFDVVKPIFGDCGSNISNADSGKVQSPNFPLKYTAPEKGMPSRTCNWFINVRPNYKILLNFISFSVEGDPLTRGCASAVLRLWLTMGEPPLELCGEKPVDPWQFLSDSNQLRISFVVADKSGNGTGFSVTWTEVLESKGPCPGFQCENSSYCISNQLRCNNVQNCGSNDLSDESNCVVEPEALDNVIFSAALTMCAVLALMLIGCLCCRRRSRGSRRERFRRGVGGGVDGGGYNRHRRHLHQQHEPRPPSLRSLSPTPSSGQHVCDELGERFTSVDSV